MEFCFKIKRKQCHTCENRLISNLITSIPISNGLYPQNIIRTRKNKLESTEEREQEGGVCLVHFHHEVYGNSDVEKKREEGHHILFFPHTIDLVHCYIFVLSKSEILKNRNINDHQKENDDVFDQHNDVIPANVKIIVILLNEKNKK